MNEQVEYVARAFFDAEIDAQVWDLAPEVIREKFRQYARDAIAMLALGEQGQSLPETEASEFSYAA